MEGKERMESVKNVPREVGIIEDLPWRYKLRGVAGEKGNAGKGEKGLGDATKVDGNGRSGVGKRH